MFFHFLYNVLLFLYNILRIQRVDDDVDDDGISEWCGVIFCCLENSVGSACGCIQILGKSM